MADTQTKKLSGQQLQHDAASAQAIARTVAKHSGGDVTLLDLRGLNSFADFFIIATTTSSAHQSALSRYVKEAAAEEGLRPYSGAAKKQLSSGGAFTGGVPSGANGGTEGAELSWYLCDLGNIIVHLMNAAAREFYDLEKLWSAGVASKIV
jgi:ribosome-associated protein